MRGRGAATLPGTPVLHNPTRGMRGDTSSPHGAASTPLPTGTGVLRRAQPATSDGASRHHSTSRTTLTILATTPSTVTQTRHPNDPQRTTREGARQTQHHRAGTTAWGSHGEHRDTPRGTGGALPPTGGVYMSGTSETGSTATEHHEIPDNGLCMQHCQGGAGNRAPTGENIFTAVTTLLMAFLPRGGRAAHSTNVPCRPHTPGTDQHRNKRNTCTQQIRLRERPLRQQGTNAEQTNQEATNTTTHRQNHYSGGNVTVNRPRAHRQAPSWPGVHGPVRERRPTS